MKCVQRQSSVVVLTPQHHVMDKMISTWNFGKAFKVSCDQKGLC